MSIPVLAQALPGETVHIATDPYTEPFWQAAKEDRLVAPQCGWCGAFRMPPTPFVEIKGKKAVVFGGASGIGRASAELLTDFDGTERALAAAIGGTFHPVDITDFDGTERTLAAVVESLGGLHISVTTAGGGVPERTLSKERPHDLESFRWVMDLNTVATFDISRLAAAHMSRNEPEDEERGVIINTSSIAAFEGQIEQVAYSASKAAIAGMCLTVARDLGSLGIRVLAIAPSLFDTGVVADIPTEMKETLTKDAAFPRRMGHPEEYAKLVLAIVDNPMLNGQCLRLDAGQRFAPK